MSDYVPSVGVARARYCDSIVRKDGVPHSFVVTPEEHAKNHAEFDRMIASVERAAAEKALTDLASKIEATSKRTDNTFTEHAVVEAGGLELLREAAEAYRKEGKEQ